MITCTYTNGKPYQTQYNQRRKYKERHRRERLAREIIKNSASSLAFTDDAKNSKRPQNNQ
jgi:hypothetical protein